MNDYITRGAAITAVKNFVKSKINEGKHTVDIVDTAIDLVNEIEKIPKVKISSKSSIVLPCKVGDTVYHVFPVQGVVTCKVKRIQIGTYGIMIVDKNGAFPVSTCFFDRKKAEAAWKGSLPIGIDE